VNHQYKVILSLNDGSQLVTTGSCLMIRRGNTLRGLDSNSAIERLYAMLVRPVNSEINGEEVNGI
jgi:hypothetical protein